VFHFLLVFNLFPIGYGPTPSKRKNIVLEQEIVKGFELVLHRKRERIFLRDGFLFAKQVGVHFQVVAYKELTTFPSEWEAWKRFSSRCCKFSSVQECSSSLEVSSFKFKVCEREVFKVS